MSTSPVRGGTRPTRAADSDHATLIGGYLAATLATRGSATVLPRRADGCYLRQLSERPPANAYVQKAEENLLAAESEYARGRYDSCASRAYYACFQAAVSALLRDGIRPSGNQWAHTFVHSRFEGQLIHRRHRYPSALRSTLRELQFRRHRADYGIELISETEAFRGLRRCREFIAAVRQEEPRR